MEAGLKRLSDLFVEGAEAYLGDGPDGPVVIWMNKLNSFETEETLRDASVRRSERMAELGEDSPELRGVRTEMALWTDEQLREAIVNGDDQELTLEAFNNLRTQDGWAELEDHISRAPVLLADESVKPGDPRFDTLTAKTSEYTDKINAEVQRLVAQRVADMAETPRDKLEAKFIEQWRDRRTTDEWMAARRISELWLSARMCSATLEGGAPTLAGERIWNHTTCDHSRRYFTERGSVTKIPDGAMVKIVEVFEGLRANPRIAGNSDAPASSSESSEPSRSAEESSPSTPIGTPLAATTS